MESLTLHSSNPRTPHRATAGWVHVIINVEPERVRARAEPRRHQRRIPRRRLGHCREADRLAHRPGPVAYERPWIPHHRPNHHTGTRRRTQLVGKSPNSSPTQTCSKTPPQAHPKTRASPGRHRRRNRHLHRQRHSQPRSTAPSNACSARSASSKQWTVLALTNGRGSADRLIDLFHSGEGHPRRTRSPPNQPRSRPPGDLEHGHRRVCEAPPPRRFPYRRLSRRLHRSRICSAPRNLRTRGAAGQKFKTLPPQRGRPARADPGDYVVHERHGIGRFVEMTSRPVAGASPGQRRAAMKEYLVIEYAPAKRGGARPTSSYPPTSWIRSPTTWVARAQACPRWAAATGLRLSLAPARQSRKSPPTW